MKNVERDFSMRTFLAVQWRWIYNIFPQVLYNVRDVLFEFHLKFWNTASIGIPVRSLL